MKKISKIIVLIEVTLSLVLTAMMFGNKNTLIMDIADNADIVFYTLYIFVLICFIYMINTILNFREQ